ncbi:MAG TPA: outer membrane beta-barrel protein [Candidatus Acidoferrum sp.]|jgi:outer membrane immunogenic protein|nr:outer membrane beta-barrel protein [Candidatus Acidoferrum sp.]
MNKSLIAGVALIALGTAVRAADLPVAPPPPAPLPAPVFLWTGFYVGANVGGAWARNNWSDTLFLTNFNNNGGVFIGGGQIGFNYQIGGFVVGAEWDVDGAANSGRGAAVTTPAGAPIVVTSNNHFISTLAARFGYATVDHLLFYGKAGGGWVGNSNVTVTDLTTGVSLTCGNFNSCGNNNGGWLLGAGIEWMFVPNWSVKVEYDYIGLGNRSFSIPATAAILAGDTLTSNNRNVQEFKFGVNYLFNWGPPIAGRYY